MAPTSFATASLKSSDQEVPWVFTLEWMVALRKVGLSGDGLWFLKVAWSEWRLAAELGSSGSPGSRRVNITVLCPSLFS
jgi:hypothetical protein